MPATLPGAATTVPPLLMLATFSLAGLLQGLVRASRPTELPAVRRPTGRRLRALHPTARRAALVSAGLASVAMAALTAGTGPAAILATILVCGPAIRTAVVARADSARKGRLLGRLAASGRMITTAPTNHLAASLTEAATDLGFDVACLLLLDEEASGFTICAARGLHIPTGGVVGTSTGVFGVEPAARLARRAVVSQDYQNWFFADPELVRDGIRGAIAAPLSVGGTPIGVLAAGRRNGTPLSPDEVDAFEVLAMHGGLGLETLTRRRAALQAVTL